MASPERPTIAAGSGPRRRALFHRNRPEAALEPTPPPILTTGVTCTVPGCANDTAQPCDGPARPGRTPAVPSFWTCPRPRTRLCPSGRSHHHWPCANHPKCGR